MLDKMNYITFNKDILSSQYLDESYGGKDGSGVSSSFLDRRNIYGDTVPFTNGTKMRNDDEDWRITMKRVKAHLGFLHTSGILKIKCDDIQQYEDFPTEEKNLQNGIDARGIQKQKEAKTTGASPDMLNLHVGNSKVTTRGRKTIFEQLRFPLKKLSLYGKYNTIQDQLENARMIKVCADVSEYSKNYRNKSKEFSNKLKFTEFTFVKLTRARNPEQEEENMDDGLASVGSYEDFKNNMPVILCFIRNDNLRDIEEVYNYENFVKDLISKSRNEFLGNEGFLFVSDNLVPM